MVKFAHMSDCHLGGWKIPEMNDLNSRTFEKAIDTCIEQEVDFVLIAGDFFDTAMPSIDILKMAVKKLKELKEKGISCYLIPGSHDYSASGKTFLDVLHNAGLCVNVGSFEELSLYEDKKTGTIVAGIAGLKTQREQEFIRKIKVPPLDNYKDKLKIIMLHTTIHENKPNELIESVDVDDLPKGFDYYALGHIHIPFEQKINGKFVTYPGPLFPNNFSELEDLGNGSFVIVNAEPGKIEVEREEIRLKDIISIDIDASGKSPELVTSEILGVFKKEDITDKIVLLRVSGVLSQGKTSDIDFKLINKEAEKRKRYALLKNTSGLESKEFKIRVNVKSENVAQIEAEVMSSKRVNENEFGKFMPLLIKCLDTEKYEGETIATFEQRVVDETSKFLKEANFL